MTGVNRLEARKRLDDASALEIVHPYGQFSDAFQGMITGGARVRGFGA